MPETTQDTITFYRDEAGEVRWRYQAAGNGEVLADSGEGYGALPDARRAAFRVAALDPEDPAFSVTASAAIRRRGSASSVFVSYADGLA